MMERKQKFKTNKIVEWRNEQACLLLINVHHDRDVMGQGVLSYRLPQASQPSRIIATGTAQHYQQRRSRSEQNKITKIPLLEYEVPHSNQKKTKNILKLA